MHVGLLCLEDSIQNDIKSGNLDLVYHLYEICLGGDRNAQKSALKRLELIAKSGNTRAAQKAAEYVRKLGGGLK